MWVKLSSSEMQTSAVDQYVCKKMGHSRPLFLYFRLFKTVYKTVDSKQYWVWLDSNREPVELEVTAPPTVPHHCPNGPIRLVQNQIFQTIANNYFFDDLLVCSISLLLSVKNQWLFLGIKPTVAPIIIPLQHTVGSWLFSLSWVTNQLFLIPLNLYNSKQWFDWF